MSTSSAFTDRLMAHAAGLRFEALPPAAIDSTKTFVLDSLGVALSGTRVPLVSTLKEIASEWGTGHAARIWGSGERVPAATAAFINGYQIHNQEWDCVHEAAVVHPMAVVLSTLLAFAESEAQKGNRISGRELITGCVVAVDVAATLGQAAKNKLRFFRPAMCGALGATAGMAAILQEDAATLRSALGLAYSQLSGTMQAHLEGSPVLPMQIGFNTRAALNAMAMARRNIQGPVDFLEGEFGYFNLIDPDWQAEVIDRLGRPHAICELSHKPFPSGRATHGGVDGVLSLQARQAFAPQDIDEILVSVPPLVIQLVDRPAQLGMAASYARLCLPYVTATALLTGSVDVTDFERVALDDPLRHALAARIRVRPNGEQALNSLSPQRVDIRLRDGRTLALDLPQVLGAPQRPLDRERHLDKFRRATASARQPLAASQASRLIALIDSLETIGDVTEIIDALIFDAPRIPA